MSEREPDGTIHETTTEARGASGVTVNFHVLAIGLAIIIIVFAIAFFVGAES